MGSFDKILRAGVYSSGGGGGQGGRGAGARGGGVT